MGGRVGGGERRPAAGTARASTPGRRRALRRHGGRATQHRGIFLKAEHALRAPGGRSCAHRSKGAPRSATQSTGALLRPPRAMQGAHLRHGRRKQPTDAALQVKRTLRGPHALGERERKQGCAQSRCPQVQHLTVNVRAASVAKCTRAVSAPCVNPAATSPATCGLGLLGILTGTLRLGAAVTTFPWPPRLWRTPLTGGLDASVHYIVAPSLQARSLAILSSTSRMAVKYPVTSLQGLCTVRAARSACPRDGATASSCLWARAQYCTDRGIAAHVCTCCMRCARPPRTRRRRAVSTTWTLFGQS